MPKKSSVGKRKNTKEEEEEEEAPVVALRTEQRSCDEVSVFLIRSEEAIEGSDANSSRLHSRHTI
jgi:hypothetical protein